MHVEAATSEDVEVLVDQWVALAREQRDYGTFILPEDNRERIREEFLRRVVTGHLLVGREDDPTGPDGASEPPGRDEAIAGFVSFGMARGEFAEDADRGVVSNLYVRPDRRDEGIGTSLLSAAHERLAADGAAVVSIEAMAANDAARRFYRDQGYEPHRVELTKRIDDE